MDRRLREPFMVTRIVNLILGIVILGLMVAVLIKKNGTEVMEMLIFVLAAIENFIGATISFSEKKKVRGNVYAIICSIFLIIALILAIRYFIFV